MVESHLNRIDELKEAWHRLSNSQPNEAIAIAREILKIADKTNDTKHSAVANNYLGICYMNMASYAEAFKYFYNSEELSAKDLSYENQLYARVNLATVSSLSGDNEQAVEHLDIAHNIAKKTNKSGYFKFLINKASILHNIEKWEESQKIIQEVLLGKKYIGKLEIGFAKYILGDNYFQLKHYKMAMENWIKALNIFEQENLVRYIAMVTGRLSEFYLYILNFSSRALKYALLELEKNEEIGQLHGKLVARNKIISCHLEMNQMDLAEEQVELFLSEYAKSDLSLPNLYGPIIKYYFAIVDIEQAEKYLFAFHDCLENPYSNALLANFYLLKQDGEKVDACLSKILEHKDQHHDLPVDFSYDFLDICYKISKEIGRSDWALYFIEQRNVLDEKAKKFREHSLVFEMHYKYETAGKEIEIERLKTEKEHLDELNNSLEMFAYNAAHDLKEPIRTIVSFSRLLGSKIENKIDQESQHFLSFINNSAEQLQNLIDELLDFAKIGSDQKDFKTIVLKKLLEEICGDLDVLVKENEATINLNSEHSVYANESLIKLVFQNLISNSIKHRRANLNPIVNISSKMLSDGFLEIKISDNGSGIEEEFMKSIFIPFAKKRSRGTGLGLSICKKIVNIHGGEISVESVINQGTTFRLKLNSSD